MEARQRSSSLGLHVYPGQLRGNGVSSLEPLLRRCERGGNGKRQACCLFWTLGSNQVGKAAIIGWRDVLAPALRNVSLWPFDGPLPSLLVPGSIVVAETYPAECYGWFSKEPLGSKRDRRNRRKLRASLLRWADAQSVTLEDGLRKEIHDGFSQGDDAFDAAVGLFGMLQVCLGQRVPGEPTDRIIRRVEGWILGRESLRCHCHSCRHKFMPAFWNSRPLPNSPGDALCSSV